MTDPIDGVRPWLEALARPAPAPGGGAAAALTVAIAAAVAAMAVGYAAPGEAQRVARRDADAVRTEALELQGRDAAASARLVAAFRDAAGDLPAALAEATDASLAAAEAAAPLAGVLRWVAEHGDPRLGSDVAVAAHLAAGAVRAAAATAAQNLAAWPDAPAAMRDRLTAVRALAEEFEALTR